MPYSAILLKDKLKNTKAKRYKYFKISLLDFEIISFNKKIKKLKNIKENEMKKVYKW